MSKASIKFEDNKIVAGIDANQDGENSVSVSLSVTEAIQEGIEALKKGEKKEVSIDVKAVNLKFDNGKVLLVIDTDQDGETLATIEVDLSESLQEIAGSIFGQ